MHIGSRVIVISGLWNGARGVVTDLRKDGDLLVALVDDQGDLGQWIMKPHELEIDDERVRFNP